MENKEYIRELLEKYLEGITSKEEESFLKSYFQKENVPKEFRSEAYWFKHTSDQGLREADIALLENEMSNWVDQQYKKEKSHKLRYWSLGIAAGLAVLIGVTFLLKQNSNANLEDTYQDPQIAYLEARKVLLYVSQTLNKGTDKLQTVSRIEEASNEMSIFSTFGSGLKNLELMSKYEEESIK